MIRRGALLLLLILALLFGSIALLSEIVHIRWGVSTSAGRIEADFDLGRAVLWTFKPDDPKASAVIRLVAPESRPFLNGYSLPMLSLLHTGLGWDWLDDAWSHMVLYSSVDLSSSELPASVEFDSYDATTFLYTFSGRAWFLEVGLWPLANAALLICGLLILAGRGWRFLRQRRGRCAVCGYDLTGLTEPRCPECGTPFDRERRVRPEERQSPV